MGLVASFLLARMKCEEKGNWDNNCGKTGSAKTSWPFITERMSVFVFSYAAVKWIQRHTYTALTNTTFVV